MVDNEEIYDKEHNKELIEKYPFLMPRNVWTGKTAEDYDYEYTFLDQMPKGWRIAFGEQMCEEIKNALIASGSPIDEYYPTQIKEKYGELRWYGIWTTDLVEDVISKYENISKHTCIKCGKPAKYITTGWISPYCEDCIQRYKEYEDIEEIDNDISG